MSKQRPRPPKLGSLPRKVAKTDGSGSRGNKGGESGKAVPSRGKPLEDLAGDQPLDLDGIHKATYGGDGVPPSHAAREQVRNLRAAAEHVDTLKGKRGMEDFWFFIHEIWGPHHPGYNKLIDDCHKRMARHFEDMIREWEWVREAAGRGEIEGYVVRYAQEAARGLGKSLIWTEAGTAWVQLRNPDASLVIDTRTEELGIAFLQPISNILRGYDQTSRFTEFYGNWYASNRIWDKTQIIHAKRKNLGQIEPSIDLAATNISQTSRHPDGVITDDPINETDVSENNVGQAIRHHRSWPNIVRVPGFHAYSGTPYMRDDVIGYMKENETSKERGSWQWIRIPALTKDKEGNEVSVAPQIRPTSWLLKKRKEDPVNFAAQFMLTPGEGEHQWVTLQQCHENLINPVDLSTAGIATIHVDAAWANERSTEKGDMTAIVQGWTTPNYGCVTDIWAKKRAKQEEYFEALIQMVKDMGVGPRQPMLITMDAETGGYGGAVRRLHQIEFAKAGLTLPPIEFINRQHQGAKERRIIMLAGQVAKGRIKFIRGQEWLSEAFYQLTHIRASGHDDIADAMADLLHPRVNQLQIFGKQASMYEQEDNAEWLGLDVPPSPSEMFSDNPQPRYNAFDDPLSMESPRHDPDYIEEVLRELMEE